jgi:peptide/nickel transport system permease protein
VSRYLVARLAGSLVTIFVTTVMVFFLVRAIPGDPLSALLGEDYDPAVAASLRRLYALDRPVPEQYLSWISSLLHGDFGYSIVSRAPVGELVAERIPRTLYLMAGGLAMGILIAVPVGILAARHRGGWLDGLITTIVTGVTSVPQFFLGLLLIILFAVTLGWLPAAGYVDPGQDLAGFLRSMVLPWLTIGLGLAAFVARVLRSSMLDALGQDYVRTARSRGASEGRVVYQHALRNAAIPTATVVGLEIGYLLGGAIVVESVFAYPGMGRLIVTSIQQRDYPVVQASILFFGVSFVIVNVLTDLIYTLLDPRIRLARA